MLTARISLTNPFVKEKFKNLFNRSYQISKNKFFEFEVVYHSATLLDLNISWTSKRDHAGLDFTVGICCFSVSFRTFDCRHWDYLNNKWEEKP